MLWCNFPHPQLWGNTSTSIVPHPFYSLHFFLVTQIEFNGERILLQNHKGDPETLNNTSATITASAFEEAIHQWNIYISWQIYATLFKILINYILKNKLCLVDSLTVWLHRWSIYITILRYHTLINMYKYLNTGFNIQFRSCVFSMHHINTKCILWVPWYHCLHTKYDVDPADL